MGHRWTSQLPSALLMVTAVGCGSARGTAAPDAPAPQAMGIVRAIRVATGTSVAEFVADVPAVESGGVCTRLPSFRDDGYRIELAFPDRKNPVRKIAVAYSATGERTYYSDERGDLKPKVVGPDGGPPRQGMPVRMLPPDGRRTSIHINLDRGTGVAFNDGLGESELGISASASEMLEAESLGVPGRMIELLEQRCAPERGRG